MIMIDGGLRHIRCDECDEDRDDEYDRDDFRMMIDQCKEDGWTVRATPGGEYEHICPDCRPSRLDKARAMFSDLGD